MKINSIYLFKKLIFETKSAVILSMHELFSIRYFLWIHWIGVIYYQKSTPTSIGSFPIWKLCGSSVSHSNSNDNHRTFTRMKKSKNKIWSPFFIDLPIEWHHNYWLMTLYTKQHAHLIHNINIWFSHTHFPTSQRSNSYFSISYSF